MPSVPMLEEVCHTVLVPGLNRDQIGQIDQQRQESLQESLHIDTGYAAAMLWAAVSPCIMMIHDVLVER